MSSRGKVVCLCLGVAAILLFVGVQSDGTSNRHSEAGMNSIYTELGGGTCRNELDKDDPNETTYLLCSGVAGYK